MVMCLCVCVCVCVCVWERERERERDLKIWHLSPFCLPVLYLEGFMAVLLKIIFPLHSLLSVWLEINLNIREYCQLKNKENKSDKNDKTPYDLRTAEHHC